MKKNHEAQSTGNKMLKDDLKGKKDKKSQKIAIKRMRVTIKRKIN